MCNASLMSIFFLTGNWWIDSCTYTSHLLGPWYETEQVPVGEVPGIYWESWKNRSHSLKAVNMLVGRDE